jgi:hypothetical protein
MPGIFISNNLGCKQVFQGVYPIGDPREKAIA